MFDSMSTSRGVTQSSFIQLSLKTLKRLCAFPILVVLFCLGNPLLAVSAEVKNTAESVDASSDDSTELSFDTQLQNLKREALSLNRDLFILKEELQFPANTQVAVFLSMDMGQFFALDSVNIKINNKEVANHLYTNREIDALSRGGIQKIHMGNIKSGDHELVAVFTGRGPKGRDYRRATSYQFIKGSDAKYVELKITDSDKLNQPEFSIRDWD